MYVHCSVCPLLCMFLQNVFMFRRYVYKGGDDYLKNPFAGVDLRYIQMLPVAQHYKSPSDLSLTLP